MTPARRVYDKPHALLGCRVDWFPGWIAAGFS
jgi:hypothetical protein